MTAKGDDTADDHAAGYGPLHVEEVERIRRAGRTWRAAIVGATATACTAIVASTAYTIATLPPKSPAAPPTPGEASYRRIAGAIEEHWRRCGRVLTPGEHAIQGLLYERLVEIDRERGRVEGEVAEAARRIGREEDAVSK